jgi:hypothetical protein
MARWSTFKEAFVLSLKSWRVWLLQFFGNAAIFLAFLWWLRISEAHWWNLLFGFVLIALTAVAALVLHGGTLNYFQRVHEDKASRLSPAFRTALKHVAAVFVWALVFFCLRWLVGKLDDYSQTVPGYLRSEFPAWLRRMISEPRLDRFYSDLVWLLRWVVLPGLFLPLALFASARGFRGLIALKDWRRVLGHLDYWITLLVASLIGVYCVSEIMGWKTFSETSTPPGETTSLVFKLLFASLLGIFAWLLTCSVLGRLRSTRQPGTQPQ